jgi:hypothetical protein
MNKRIEIDVLPDGSIKIEGHGFKGPECEKATKFIEDALGKVSERKRKPEYSMAAMQAAKIGARQ